MEACFIPRTALLVVSFSSRYETFVTHTNLPQAVSLANIIDPAPAAGPDGTEPGCAAHHPLGRGRGIGARRDRPSDPICASPSWPRAIFRRIESRQPLLVRVDRSAGGI